MTGGQDEGKKKKRGEAKLGSVIKGSLWERGIWNKFCKKKKKKNQGTQHSKQGKI